MSTDEPTRDDRDEFELDDEFEYHGYLVGRPTRTVEVSAPNGTSTIQEGKLNFKLACKEDIWHAREDDGWINHYVGPDGGVGFGLDEGNPGGVSLSFDLEGVIEFDEPMTEKEADGFLEDNPETWEEFVDESIESDKTAADLLEELR